MNLTHDAADIIRHLIVDLGSGTLPTDGGDWPVYTANEPDTPDNCITTYNTTGTLQGRINQTGSHVEKYGVQIRVRGVNHAVGFAKGATIENKMDTEVYRDVVTIASSQYLVHAVSKSGTLIFAGKDSSSSKRFIFTLNLLVDVRQLS